MDTFGRHLEKIRVSKVETGDVSIEPLGRSTPSARADCETRQQTVRRESRLLVKSNLLLDVGAAVLSRGQHGVRPNSFFSFLFFFPSFSFLFLVFLGFLEREKGCPFMIQEVPSSGLKRLKLKKCLGGPRHKRTSYRIQFLWILLRVKAKFCIFNLLNSSPHLSLVKVGIFCT